MFSRHYFPAAFSLLLISLPVSAADQPNAPVFTSLSLLK